MYNKEYHYKRYCSDIENVENYEKAKADNFVDWNIHHRLETHNSDGERRPIDISRQELIALGTYLNRPACELIFMTKREHNALHNKSVETRKKISETAKRNMTEERRRKISAAGKGRWHSEEAKKKISIANKGRPSAHKGRRWYNNGKINVRRYECPEGFVPGRL